MKIVACMIKLGRTRTAGYTLYEEANHEFQETTPMVTKDLISRGQVKGLKLVQGTIELDEEFNMHNLMIKSGVGRYTPLYPTTSIISCTYVVVKEIKTDKETLYILISNKCARFKLKEEQLKGLIKIGGYIGGVRIIENEIVLCKGVSILDLRTKEDTEVKELLNAESTIIDSISPKVDEVNLQKEQGLTEIGNESEKIDSLDTTFDTLDATKLTAEFVATSAEKSSNTDNIAECKDDRLPEEHTEKKKKMSVRKTKLKL